MKKIIIVILLLSIFSALAISSMLQQSGTCDEIAHHIPAGYSYYKKWDFRLNPSNPPLSRYIMAFPLAFLDLKAPFDDKSWQEADTPAFGRKFFFEYNKEKSRTILLLSRLAMVFVGIFTGFLTYLMASQIYGRRAGLFALFLFCFTPEIIAHASLATTDITAACFMLLALYAFWKFMKLPTKTKLFMAGITLGLAQLSKYSAVIFYPIFLILALTEWLLFKKKFSKIFNSLILIFVISIVTIWLGYGCRMKPFLAETTKQEEKIAFVQNLGVKIIPFWNNELSHKTETFLKENPLPLTTYITGFLGVMKHNKESHRMFFLGKWSNRGSYLYYVVAFLIKTPVVMIFFLFMAIFSLLYKRLSKDELYLILPAAIIFLAASMSKLQLGTRYILPIYPLCIIFSSRIIRLIKNNAQRTIVALLAIWLVLANIFAWPHYLSYFNEFIGGANHGWKYLRDSNIDWGQNLPALSKYMKKNDIKEITLEYFGQDDPALYGINFEEFSYAERIKPLNKIYAISAQYLENVPWFSVHEPTAKAGYSIFIYDFRKAGK
ncbi:MAG: glycosyltransferase family 39 protein [Candidatus Omnitrophica bacterium]|nr:glycosyltransferase family 39 protein [Candidatus Omnitrophota bacterium]